MAKGFTVELKGAKKGGNGMVYALGAVGTAFAVDYWLSNRDGEASQRALERWHNAVRQIIERKRAARNNWDRALELAQERIAAEKAARAAKARERWAKAIRRVMDRQAHAQRNWDRALRVMDRKIAEDKKTRRAHG
jgi:exonuclease VII large subunit